MYGECLQMRIGIDVRMLQPSTGLTGIATSLLETIRELNNIDYKNEYFLFSRKPIHCDIQFNNNWHLIDKDFPQGMVWYNTVLLKLIKENKIDVFWNANHILPMRKVSGCRYLVTINDIAILKMKGIGEYSNILKQQFFVKRACKSATKVIAISEATKQDLQEVLNVSTEKIYVNYLGGMSGQRLIVDEKETAGVFAKYKIDKNFFLYLGTLEPRKNLITLVKAFEKYREENLGEENLVIAGGKGWRFEETQEYINHSKWRDNILQLGYVSNEEKAVLMSKTTAFLFPSLYEGFGIPILEAMESGVPVITSKVSSMPEVGGDLAFYIDNPSNVEKLKEQLLAVSQLDGIARKRIAENELEWVKQFTWKKTAERFMTLVSNM